MFEEAGLEHVLAEPYPVRFPNFAFARRLFDAPVVANTLPENELRSWLTDLEWAEE